MGGIPKNIEESGKPGLRRAAIPFEGNRDPAESWAPHVKRESLDLSDFLGGLGFLEKPGVAGEPRLPAEIGIPWRKQEFAGQADS